MLAATEKNLAVRTFTLDQAPTEGPWSYRAYGLSIRSDLPLPEFEPAEETGAPPTVTVNWIPEDSPPTGEQATLSIGRREATLNVPSVGLFTVSNGCTITTRSRQGVEPVLLRLYVEGMIIATLLYQRGLQVLHSSVVQIDQSAIALMGHCGAGKSSTAAALHARGHAVISDDNAALDYCDGRICVHPAYPYLKMFPEIATALGFDSSQLRTLHNAAQKRGQAVLQKFPRSPIHLKAVYILSKDAGPGLEPLTKAAAVIETIRNTVPTRWGHTADATHLQQCAKLAQSIPFYRARTFSTLQELPELAASIEQHARS